MAGRTRSIPGAPERGIVLPNDMSIAAILIIMSAGASGQPAAPSDPAPPPVSALPVPVADPLAIDFSGDPILALARNQAPADQFRALVQRAVERHPAVDESIARIVEARAARSEAVAGLYPRGEVAVMSSATISREFEATSLLDNLTERSRPDKRSDVSLTIEETLFDFGATRARIAAAGARLVAEARQAEASADQTALYAISAWYDVLAYRARVDLTAAFTESQVGLRAAIQDRIAQGVSAPGDLPRVDSYIASTNARLAQDKRQLANAEARFEEYFGVAPPADLGRAPAFVPGMSKDYAQLLARSGPAVESAEATARAARHEAKSEHARNLPTLTAGVDAGKYGFHDIDYDVRGRVTIRHNLFGALHRRAEQADARADAASARAARVRGEAEREAAIAWADVRALEEQLIALERSYIASRQSRDVLAERFRVARGTLFDLLDAESGYFNIAASYISAMTELDAARYALLSRTGKLLEALAIPTPEVSAQ